MLPQISLHITFNPLQLKKVCQNCIDIQSVRLFFQSLVQYLSKASVWMVSWAELIPEHVPGAARGGRWSIIAVIFELLTDLRTNLQHFSSLIQYISVTFTLRSVPYTLKKQRMMVSKWFFGWTLPSRPNPVPGGPPKVWMSP